MMMEYIMDGSLGMMPKQQEQQGTMTTMMDMDAAENGERSHRMDPLQMAHDQAHARVEAGLIGSSSHARLKCVMATTRRRTRLVEEAERTRRVASKSEAGLRRKNAYKAAHIIQSLGWPFLQSSMQAPKCIIVHDSVLVSEKERQRRQDDTVGAFIARTNAALVSNLIRWAQPLQYTNMGITLRSATQVLEERERARRLADRGMIELASHNAYVVSRLIKNLGWPFYVQQSIPASSSSVAAPLATLQHIGENVKDAAATALPIAKHKAQNVAGTLRKGASAIGLTTIGATAMVLETAAETALPAAKQTVRNAAGTLWKSASAIGFTTLGAAAFAVEAASQAIHNVMGQGHVDHHHVSSVAAMVPHHALTTAELEDKERRHRMKIAYSQARCNAHHEAELMQTFFGSRPLFEYLYETERAWQIADIAGSEIARSNAGEVATLIRDHFSPQTRAVEGWELETVPCAIQYVPAAGMFHTRMIPRGSATYRATKSYIVADVDAPVPHASRDIVSIIAASAYAKHAHNAPLPRAINASKSLPIASMMVPQAAHDSNEESAPHPHHGSRSQYVSQHQKATIALVEDVHYGPFIVPIMDTASLQLPASSSSSSLYQQPASLASGLPQKQSHKYQHQQQQTSSSTTVITKVVEPAISYQQPADIVEIPSVFIAPVPVVAVPVVVPVAVVTAPATTVITQHQHQPTIIYDANNYSQYYDSITPVSVPQQQQQQQTQDQHHASGSIKDRLRAVSHRFRAGNPSM
eukprot:TRINITY_DN10381_c0_g1_i3.p1 TRINITY_DN10381_c0_g1~~TRINITY_DN10381_c0_g1_i3.p1  ORF type:complete len:754 (+),score=158.41 TRINITY_DN10381_c0_g1_i3:107-2368(+)